METGVAQVISLSPMRHRDDVLTGGPHMNGDSCTGGGGADVLNTCNP